EEMIELERRLSRRQRERVGRRVVAESRRHAERLSGSGRADGPGDPERAALEVAADRGLRRVRQHVEAAAEEELELRVGQAVVLEIEAVSVGGLRDRAAR